MKHATECLFIVASLAFVPQRAEADRAEKRYTLSGVGTELSLGEAGGTASFTTMGARFRWAYGLTDTLELSLVDIGFAAMNGASYRGATFKDASGQSQIGNLVGDLYLLDLSIGV